MSSCRGAGLSLETRTSPGARRFTVQIPYWIQNTFQDQFQNVIRDRFQYRVQLAISEADSGPVSGHVPEDNLETVTEYNLELVSGGF